MSSSKKSDSTVLTIMPSGPDGSATGREKAPFGASITVADHRNAPANEQQSAAISGIVLDDSLPGYVATAAGVVVHCNQLYLEFSGHFDERYFSAGKPEMIGRGPEQGLQQVIEDITARQTTLRQEERLSVAGKERLFLGRHVPVFGPSGDLVAVAGSYEDITRQSRAIAESSLLKARFEDYARASTDWYYECDTDLRLIELADRFTAVMGQPARLFIGSHLQQLGHFQENLDGRHDLMERVAERKPFREQLLVTETSHGDVLKFHLSGVPVFDAQTGDFAGYRGAGMDVTDRYQQIERADHARRELENLLTELTTKNIELDVERGRAQSALKAKNEFLAAMSHELRTPLNAIIGFGQSFERQTFGDLSPKYASFAKEIVNSGEHLLALINDILDVAVIESGGLSLHVEILSLQDVVDSAISMTSEVVRNKSMLLSVQPLTAPLHVSVDRRRAIQIVVNLLTNAVKFTPEKGELGIDIAERDDAIELTVWDKGVGISADNQSVIFEKFRQVTDDVYSRSQEGTGLGLHISRELARKMGGDLTVSSQEGQGSRFTVSLPLAQEERDASIADDDENFI